MVLLKECSNSGALTNQSGVSSLMLATIKSAGRVPRVLSSPLFMVRCIRCTDSILCIDTSAEGGPRLCQVAVAAPGGAPRPRGLSSLTAVGTALYLFAGLSIPIPSSRAMRSRYQAFYFYREGSGLVICISNVSEFWINIVSVSCV